MNHLKKLDDRIQFLWLFPLLVFISAFVMSSVFYIQQSAYWDNISFFSILRDQWHSLNKFGEIAYWFPHNQSGWPAYYYSILGDSNIGSPLFLLFGFVIFCCGKLGISIEYFHPIYTFYYAIATPLLFLLSSFYCLRKFFRSNFLIFFGLTIMAFSPGVIFNLSDIGFLEPQCYFLFYVGSLLGFLQNPSQRNFFVLVLCLEILAITFNYSALFWTALFLPLVTFILAFRSRSTAITTLHKFKNIGWAPLVISACLILVTLVPNLTVLSQAGDLIRSRMGSKYYSLHDLLSGNPLEVLIISLPFFGYDLINGQWQIHDSRVHISYVYLGTLTLPLLLMALFRGPRFSRNIVIWSLVICFIVFLLASYSPLFSLLLILPTPLQGNNHYGDALIRSGGFMVLVFGALIGLKALARTGDFPYFRNLFIRCFGFNIIAFLALRNFDVFSSVEFGVYFLLGLAMLATLSQVGQNSKRSGVLLTLAALTLIDVSTISYIYIRNQFTKGKPVIETQNQGGLGLADPQANTYANGILMYRPFLEMTSQKFNLNLIPYFQFYTMAHQQPDMATEFQSAGNFSQYQSIQIDHDFSDQAPFKKFFRSYAPIAKGGLDILERTYNRIRLQISVDQDALFFIRDSYSPYWTARINEVDVPIARALYNFKVIPIPAGQSELLLEFNPPIVKYVFALAYIVIFLTGGWVMYCSRRQILNSKILGGVSSIFRSLK